VAAGARILTATLELELDGPLPEGAITEPGGQRRAFQGWIELAAAIDDLRRSPGIDAAEPPSAQAEEG
jgi:hypothetical protein